MTTIQRTRQKVIDRSYYLSSHAEDEMWADGLERSDIENAILKGKIEKRMTHETLEAPDIAFRVRLKTEDSFTLFADLRKEEKPL